VNADMNDAIIARRVAAAEPRLAGEADIPALARVMAAAFAEDPVTNWILRDGSPEERAALRERFFAAALASRGIPAGASYFAPEAGAGAVWIPPAMANSTTSPLAMLRMLPHFFAFSGWRLPRLLRLIQAVDANHPREPHHYLLFLGVDPAYHGQGLGSSILAATLARVDAEGMPAYLENSNPKNTRLYERHGFRTTKEVALAKGGPHLWCMWREPHGRQD
jgi:ribosomal protein S18 acetylase RimI-like enzyme